MVKINEKTPANKIKKVMIRVTAIGEKTIACQCLKTYDQALPEEKKSLPFNCFKVTRLTAVQENRISRTQAEIPS